MEIYVPGKRKYKKIKTTFKKKFSKVYKTKRHYGAHVEVELELGDQVTAPKFDAVRAIPRRPPQHTFFSFFFFKSYS